MLLSLSMAFDASCWKMMQRLPTASSLVRMGRPSNTKSLPQRCARRSNLSSFDEKLGWLLRKRWTFSLALVVLVYKRLTRMNNGLCFFITTPPTNPSDFHMPNLLDLDVIPPDSLSPAQSSGPSRLLATRDRERAIRIDVNEQL